MQTEKILAWAVHNRLTLKITRHPATPTAWTATFEPPVHWVDNPSKGKEAYGRGPSAMEAVADLASDMSGRTVRISNVLTAPGESSQKVAS